MIEEDSDNKLSYTCISLPNGKYVKLKSLGAQCYGTAPLQHADKNKQQL